MTEEVHITLFKKADRWRFEIKYGNYRLAGSGDGFEDAEEKALKALTGLPKHDTIHIHYAEGKPVLPRKEAK
jgi:hypothetical protein